MQSHTREEKAGRHLHRQESIQAHTDRLTTCQCQKGARRAPVTDLGGYGLLIVELWPHCNGPGNNVHEVVGLSVNHPGCRGWG